MQAHRQSRLAHQQHHQPTKTTSTRPKCLEPANYPAYPRENAPTLPRLQLQIRLLVCRCTRDSENNVVIPCRTRLVHPPFRVIAAQLILDLECTERTQHTRIWKCEVSTIVLPSNYRDAEVRLADVGRQRGLIVQVPCFREGLFVCLQKKNVRLARRLERTGPFMDEYI